MEKYDSSLKYRVSIQNYLIDTGDGIILIDTGIPADFKGSEYNENAMIYNGDKICEYMGHSASWVIIKKMLQKFYSHTNILIIQGN